MAVNFPDYVPLWLVDTVGLTIGVFVILVVVYESIRWRGVLAPIVRGLQLGVGRWFSMLVRTLAGDVVYQQISPKCPDRGWVMHSLVFWGFLLLMLSTTLNWLMNPTGGPLPLTHPVRVSGNVGGLMLIVGLLSVLYRIAVKPEKREVTFGADYLFMALLFLAGITGFLTELVSELDAVASVYPVYAVHLAASAMLLLLAPFTRFIHAFGRSVIRLSERYLEALAREQLVKPMELAVTPLLVEE